MLKKINRKKNYFTLRKFCHDLGADLFGVADIRGIREEFVLSKEGAARFDKAISLGVRLSQAVLEEVPGAPNRLYYHHYRAINVFLDQLSLRVTNFIQQRGYWALPVAASQVLDWQKQLAHLSHKKIGLLAGLGWIGRNNLLVNKKLGSQIRLVTILTDMPLTLNKPSNDNCGKCYKCVQLCPASAIKDNPAEFEHQKCFDKLKEFYRQRLVEQYICGVCVRACKGTVL